MILSLQGQARLFLLTVLVGAVLGLAYDCLRLFRHTLPHGRLWVQLEDGLFWLCSVFFVFNIMLHANSGEIRFFIILGLYGGMGLYFLTFSRIVIAVSDRIIFAVKKLISLLLNIILTPLRLIFMLISIPAAKIGGFCGNIRKKVLQNCNFYVRIKTIKLRRDWRMALKRLKKGGDGKHGKGKNTGGQKKHLRKHPVSKGKEKH